GPVMRLDRADDGGMLREHAPHAPRHRQGEPAIAIDLNLHLLDEAPDAGMAGGLRDRRMERLVGFVETVAVAARLDTTLALEQLTQPRDPTRIAALGREPGRRLLERGAHQDRFGERAHRDARDEWPRL